MSQKRNEMGSAVADLLQNMDIQIKYTLAMAKLCRAYYLQLGFSEQEALELCKYFKG